MRTVLSYELVLLKHATIRELTQYLNNGFNSVEETIDATFALRHEAERLGLARRASALDRYLGKLMNACLRSQPEANHHHKETPYV